MHEVVVGIDSSATAHDAAVRAAEMAAKLGLGLHIVSAVNKPEVEQITIASVNESFRYDNVAESDTMVKTVALELAASHGIASVTTSVLPGDAAVALCHEAERLSASMIVVGNKRVQGAARVLGSVAGHVMRQAPCDVLVVHTN
jgi:nucleotide-binding universal stress UspA family protein